MKVSVVIPAHNEEKYLAKCLKSLQEQKFPKDKFEIIVVDNNSTDTTGQIARAAGVKVIVEKEQGITPARNRGFNEAQYEIIARTDADTILPPDWLKHIEKAFQDKKLIALSGPAEFYDLPDFVQNAHLRTKPTGVKIITSYNRIVNNVLKHDCLYGPNYSFRKSVWEKVKNDVCLNDRDVHEDLDLAIHFAPFGKIKFEYNFVVQTSVRRWKKPEAYLEYLYRGFKSIRKHKQLVVEQKGKEFVKKIFLKAFGPLD